MMMKRQRSTVILACILLVLSIWPLFIGVLDMEPPPCGDLAP